MLYVLRHRTTSEIYTCILINSYELAYYGTKFWQEQDQSAAEDQSLLEDQRILFLQTQGLEAESELWELLEVEENQLKIYNVKLKNDPKLKLFLDEQDKPYTQLASDY